MVVRNITDAIFVEKWTFLHVLDENMFYNIVFKGY